MVYCWLHCLTNPTPIFCFRSPLVPQGLTLLQSLRVPEDHRARVHCTHTTNTGTCVVGFEEVLDVRRSTATHLPLSLFWLLLFIGIRRAIIMWAAWMTSAGTRYSTVGTSMTAMMNVRLSSILQHLISQHTLLQRQSEPLICAGHFLWWFCSKRKPFYHQQQHGRSTWPFGEAARRGRMMPIRRRTKWSSAVVFLHKKKGVFSERKRRPHAS